jgi:hypothetical protein
MDSLPLDTRLNGRQLAAWLGVNPSHIVKWVAQVAASRDNAGRSDSVGQFVGKERLYSWFDVEEIIQIATTDTRHYDRLLAKSKEDYEKEGLRLAAKRIKGES